MSLSLDGVAARTGDRLQLQGRNSGGFLAPIQPEFLDHTRCHPHLEVKFLPAAQTVKAVRGRRGRQLFVPKTYEPLMRNGVLDVGCDASAMRPLVRGLYTGVDLYGNPDVRFDLSSGNSLPFADQSYPFVVCTDVLEHLDHPHFYCDELFRVSAEHVLIGLPNCYHALWRSLRCGRPVNKNYGLPPEVPGDRHRWVFTAEESFDFALYRAARCGFEGVQCLHFVVWVDWGRRRRNSLAAKVLYKARGTIKRAFWASKPAFAFDWDWINSYTLSSWWLLRRNTQPSPKGGTADARPPLQNVRQEDDRIAHRVTDP